MTNISWKIVYTWRSGELPLCTKQCLIFNIHIHVLDWTVVTSGFDCSPGQWTRKYYTSTQDCVNYIRTRSDCNQMYTLHAIRTNGDCSCLSIGLNCEDNSHWKTSSPVDIIKMVDTSGHLIYVFFPLVLNDYYQNFYSRIV